METTKQAISLNEQPKPQAETLADLPVTAEQAQQIAGGTDVIVSAGPGAGGHVKVFNGATGIGNVPSSGGGGYTNNHNETVAYDETDLDELEDLLLTDAQEADIQGGGTWPPPGGNVQPQRDRGGRRSDNARGAYGFAGGRCRANQRRAGRFGRREGYELSAWRAG